MFLIVESLDKDWKATSRNVVRNFNKDLLPEEVKFYLIYYYSVQKYKAVRHRLRFDIHCQYWKSL